MHAIILDVRPGGLILSREGDAEGAEEFWLPADEWSTDPHGWKSAMPGLEPGSQLDVVQLSGSVEDRPVVSRKRFAPEHLDSGWLNSIREMRIDEISKILIRGTIDDTISTEVNGASYLEWVISKEPTQDLLDHAVLGKGDWVRGFVKSISGNYGSVVLDIPEYLEFRSREIANAIESPNLSEVNEHGPELSANKLSKQIVDAINPVLLADDSLPCRESIAALLQRHRLEVHTLNTITQARAFVKSISRTASGLRVKKPFRLAIVDPNLAPDSTDLVGLEVAQALQTETTCRIVLISGELTNSKKLKDWPDLKIHGYLEKPFTMNALIEAITEAIALDKPVRLADWLQIDLKSSPYTVDSSASPFQSEGKNEMPLEQVLQSLGRLKPGSVIHVFDLHPRSLRARSLASVGSGLNWTRFRGKIEKSVIKDAAFSISPIIESNAAQKLTHLWTLQMMPYQSFCGIPVRVKGKRLALVAFHPDARAFNDEFVTNARLASEQVGRIIETKTLYETRRNEATLASSGMALASLAHELSSELTALDANLMRMNMLLPDIRNADESTALLTRIRNDVADISSKTKTLRGGHTRLEPISLVDCLNKASSACRIVIAETIENPERIVINSEESPSSLWMATAPAASLIIVFFNLYLNAAQQIALCSRVRKVGRIWSTINRFDSPGGPWAKIRIHDTGPGIHQDDWEDVFEPGYSTKPNGSGLGLYICRHLLRAISGNLSITSSAIWDGTTVTVSIPLAVL